MTSDQNATAAPRQQRVLILVGLPGSGKTTLAEALGQVGYVVRDDVRHPDVLLGSLGRGEDAVAASCLLCDPTVRADWLRWLDDHIHPPATLVQWWFFANDPAVCLANVRRREVGLEPRGVEATLQRLAALYQVPEGVMVLPVYRPAE